MSKPDYRRILAAYIRHVGVNEGVYFLPRQPAELGLTEAEARALFQVASECPDIEEDYKAELLGYLGTDGASQ